jgi:hypothetical protein
MPNTFELISSNTLSTTAASVTFSSIPGTYTDLVVIASVRNDNAATSGGFILRLNNDSSSLYANTVIRGDGSTLQSFAQTGTSSFIGTINASTSTSNTFSVVEIYIPSYTVAQDKPFTSAWAQEDNATSAFLGAAADLYRSNTAISQINCISSGTALWIAGSSFYLYGIKNS